LALLQQPILSLGQLDDDELAPMYPARDDHQQEFAGQYREAIEHCPAIVKARSESRVRTEQPGKCLSKARIAAARGEFKRLVNSGDAAFGPIAVGLPHQ